MNIKTRNPSKDLYEDSVTDSTAANAAWHEGYRAGYRDGRDLDTGEIAKLRGIILAIARIAMGE